MIEFQVFVCLVLVTRLAYLYRDDSATWRFGLGLALAQAALLLLTFEIASLTLVVAGSLVVVTTLGSWCERWFSPHWCRLAVLAVVIASTAGFSALLGGWTFSALAQGLAGVGHELVSVMRGSELPDAGRFAAVVMAMLLLANEVNMLMRGIFHSLGLEPRADSTAEASEAVQDVREYNAGRVIGILERWLLFLVVLLSDDWSALGLIIAAKGLVRLDKLKDPVFAEYMLIGTLLSALFAIGATYLVQ